MLHADAGLTPRQRLRLARLVVEEDWPTVRAAEFGLGTARVWALYLAGSRLGFERNEIQLHQVLATRTTEGDSGAPLRPDWGV